MLLVGGKPLLPGIGVPPFAFSGRVENNSIGRETKRPHLGDAQSEDVVGIPAQGLVEASEMLEHLAAIRNVAGSVGWTRPDLLDLVGEGRGARRADQRLSLNPRNLRAV